MREENCPVCGSIIDLADYDPCRHYAGDIWDGDFIWHYKGEAPKALEALQKICSEFANFCYDQDLDEKMFGQFELVIAKTAGQNPFWQLLYEPVHREILDCDPAPDMCFREIIDLVGIIYGEPYTTDGMLGGSGVTLFIDDLSRVREAQTYLERMLSLLPQELKSCKDNESSLL